MYDIKALEEEMAAIGDDLLAGRHGSVMSRILGVLPWRIGRGLPLEKRDAILELLHRGNVAEYNRRMRKWGQRDTPYNTAVRIVNYVFHPHDLDWMTCDDYWGPTFGSEDIEKYLEIARDYIESDEEMKAYKGILLYFIVNKILPENEDFRDYNEESLTALEECAERLKTELGVEFVESRCKLRASGDAKRPE